MALAATPLRGGYVSGQLGTEKAAAPARAGPRRPRSGRSGSACSPTLATPRLAGELVLESAHDEVHDRHVRLYTVELQLPVQLLRDPRRQLDPDLSFACHLASLPPVRMDTATFAYNYRDSLRSATPPERIQRILGCMSPLSRR